LPPSCWRQCASLGSLAAGRQRTRRASNLQITKDHYIRSQQHQMLHRYQGAIVDLIAGVTAESLNLAKG
jgi:hypothetical protein